MLGDASWGPWTVALNLFRSLFSWIMLGDPDAPHGSADVPPGFDPCSPGSCWATSSVATLATVGGCWTRRTTPRWTPCAAGAALRSTRQTQQAAPVFKSRYRVTTGWLKVPGPSGHEDRLL